MSQSQDKNKPGVKIAKKAEIAENEGVTEAVEIQGSGKNKWYQNNWFILTVSIIMIALLVFSVFLSHQWGTIERTIFGNKAFYYKMEMNNFSSLTSMFTSSIDYSYEAKTSTTGEIEINNIESGALDLVKAPLNDIVVGYSYENDDDEEVSKAELTLYKKGTDRKQQDLEQNENGTNNESGASTEIQNDTTAIPPIAKVGLFLNNEGVFAEFPNSGYATALYDVNENISRRMFTFDWVNAINNSEVNWAIYDVLQEVNNVIPDDIVFHYDEVEFDNWPAHKIEFVLGQNTQLNIKNTLLESIGKKEFKQVLSNVEKSLEEKLAKNSVSTNKNNKKNNTKSKNTLYKLIKNYIEKIPCDRGDIIYNVIYDNDQNILSREVLLQDNRIQILSYMEDNEFVLGFFNEKLGINVENKCTFNNDSKGVDGRLIIDSGTDELGVIYQCSSIIGGVIPIGNFEIVAGRTGVAEKDSGAVPVWKVDFNIQKERENVSAEFVYEKNQKQVISVTGNFLVDDLNEKVETISSDKAKKSKPINQLSTEKILAETIWNYTLAR